MPAATSPGLRITRWATRYQRPVPSGAGFTRPIRPASSTSSAGTTSRAAAHETSAVAAPPIPIEIRNRCGNSVSVSIAAATVTALKVIVRPAVRSVVASALGTSAPVLSSSRKRHTSSRL